MLSVSPFSSCKLSNSKPSLVPSFAEDSLTRLSHSSYPESSLSPGVSLSFGLPPLCNGCNKALALGQAPPCESLLSSSVGHGHSHICPSTGREMGALAWSELELVGLASSAPRLSSHSLPSGAQTCPPEGLSSGFSGSDSETRPCSGPEASGHRTYGEGVTPG